jgi:mono/diheme cytochrome c family protein
MGAMRRTVLFALVWVPVWWAVSKSAIPGTPGSDKSEIERGRYLVEEVAKCAECHTPRNARGELDSKDSKSTLSNPRRADLRETCSCC